MRFEIATFNDAHGAQHLLLDMSWKIVAFIEKSTRSQA